MVRSTFLSQVNFAYFYTLHLDFEAQDWDQEEIWNKFQLSYSKIRVFFLVFEIELILFFLEMKCRAWDLNTYPITNLIR